MATAFVLQDQSPAEVFAANRARGTINLSVDAIAGRTRRKSVHEDGSLRVRFPHEGVDPLEAILINTAGGMTGGDRFSIEMSVGSRASFVAGTAAAEKIYRSTGSDTQIDVRLSVADEARMTWLPQETILFDEAQLSRSFDVSLEGNAHLLTAEAVVFGRSAMGETVTQGRLFDRWRVRRDGRLIYADGVRLDGAIQDKLSERAVTAAGVAIATVLTTPADETVVETVRAHEGEFTGSVGISAWNGIAVTRLCANDATALRRDLVIVLAALKTPVPRLWLN